MRLPQPHRPGDPSTCSNASACLIYCNRFTRRRHVIAYYSGALLLRNNQSRKTWPFMAVTWNTPAVIFVSTTPPTGGGRGKEDFAGPLAAHHIPCERVAHIQHHFMSSSILNASRPPVGDPAALGPRHRSTKKACLRLTPRYST